MMIPVGLAFVTVITALVPSTRAASASTSTTTKTSLTCFAHTPSRTCPPHRRGYALDDVILKTTHRRPAAALGSAHPSNHIRTERNDDTHIQTADQITRDILTRYELTNSFERWNFLQKLLENELPPRDVENALVAVLNGYLKYGPVKEEESGGDASPVLDEERWAAMRSLMEGILSLDGKNDDGDPGVLEEEQLQKKQRQEEGVNSRFLHHFVRPPIDYERELFHSSITDTTATIIESSNNIPSPPASSLLTQIEQLLPHPTEEEEAHKSAWDLIIELYGRESVRVREEKLQRWGAEVGENREWKTLCCLGRVLIHYDFLTRGVLFVEGDRMRRK
ncbi:hypothetical protein HJC23_010351 [Cyclotella cryptica]|uniref:Uncharacterized protein n=1 Tax=Cyclotella cryptica TaxID=29204 RepID=A0ABD3NZH1_9STRA|eukprot:CCRYP_019059-RA/>CCRYP_019059-RA protein AED:0.17 eAED:0.17 QI:0/-1/0/1/-1/1/1/0/335